MIFLLFSIFPLVLIPIYSIEAYRVAPLLGHPLLIFIDFGPHCMSDVFKGISKPYLYRQEGH